MAIKKSKGLGRGLDALLNPSGANKEVKDADLVMISLDSLVKGKWQPRGKMDEQALCELADSIKAQGVIQPIIIRQISSDLGFDLNPKYEIIAGERRSIAAKIAGLVEIPAVIKQVGDEAAAAMALIENIQREDLNPLEQARALLVISEKFDLTHEEIAKAIGKSRSATSNIFRLLNLTDPVQEMLLERQIEMGHARALLALSGANQLMCAKQVISRKLNVRQTEELVKSINLEKSSNNSDNKKSELTSKSNEIIKVEQNLSDILAAPVEIKIKNESKWNGTININFKSLDELNSIIEFIQKNSE